MSAPVPAAVPETLQQPTGDDGTPSGTERTLLNEERTVGLPVASIALALIRRPDLYTVAARAGLSMAGRGWWRKRPFLPLPDPEWLRFRLATAYGGDGTLGQHSDFEVADLITWLEWRKDWPA